MQSTLLVSQFEPRAIAIRPVQAGTKKPSYVLTFEKLDTPAGKSITCTARFLPAATFDETSYTPLLSTPIYGCLGLVQVENEPFICVITDCSAIGDIEGSTIYRINNVVFFSLTSNRCDNLSENGGSFTVEKQIDYNSADMQEQFETLRHPCQPLQRFISSGSFYYSYDFDLTRCAQIRLRGDTSSFWERADERFFWNRHIVKELLKFRKQLPEADQVQLDQEGILVMATSGFVRIEETNVSGDRFKIAIISRLSCLRAGTRFNTRGIDDDGNVANSVETELLIYTQDLLFSYLILRGSVPVFWEQQGLQLANHKIQISRSAAGTQPAVERHFRDLTERYGKQHVVNLLSQKEGSSELVLTEAFVQHVNNLKMSETVKFTNFDFHHMVKGNNFDNLAVLISNVRSSMDEYGFFLYNTKTKQVILLQNGTFRVNCLDCLDRTNVVQGILSKSSLATFCKSACRCTADQIFQTVLNDMWADNGDELSRIYTGTGALKSGFTRTGKRTLAGFMDDAKKSAARFYMNNFQDKYKQEVIDTLLGKLANQAEIRLHNPIREAVNDALNQRLGEFASKRKITVHIGTYNVNAKEPRGESLVPWLSFDRQSNRPDMFVVGFQEIVELSPQQIMATDSSKRLVWEDILLKTLNPNPRTPDYVILKSGQLVGAALCIFVKSEFVANIRNVDGAIKKTGMAGLAGNKGGVAIRMDFFDTSLCFVCAHLAAGHSNVEERNRDYRTISEGLTFNKGRKIADHENIIWLGDFNYRIDLPNEEVRARISDISFLFRHDQLQNQMREGAAFQGYKECPIQFQPTYKFDNGTNNYDSSEKNRIPAWTDRILIFGTSIAPLRYDRAELMSSDHKPVKALFDVEIKIVDKEKRDKIQQELYKKYTQAATNFPKQANAKAQEPWKTMNSPTKTSQEIKLIDFDDVPSQVQAAPAPQQQKAPAVDWFADFNAPAATPQQVPPKPQRGNTVPSFNTPSFGTAAPMEPSSSWADFGKLSLNSQPTAPQVSQPQVGGWANFNALPQGNTAAAAPVNPPPLPKRPEANPAAFPTQATQNQPSNQGWANFSQLAPPNLPPRRSQT